MPHNIFKIFSPIPELRHSLLKEAENVLISLKKKKRRRNHKWLDGIKKHLNKLSEPLVKQIFHTFQKEGKKKPPNLSILSIKQIFQSVNTL